MNARPRSRPPAQAPTFAEIVEQTLAPARLQELSHPEDWPEPPFSSAELPRGIWDRAIGDLARDILNRPSHQFRARLCALAWRLSDGPGATRGSAPTALPASLPFLIEVIHAGSLIVDDIEDGSLRRRGAPCLHRLHGVPLALNAGTWMYFWAMDLVESGDLPVTARDQIRRALVAALYRGHLGQSLDLSVAIADMPRQWIYSTVATSTMLKTGALMELAARLGALAAEAAAPRVDALARFGRRLGVGLQMLDDFGNLNAPATETPDSKALEDLRNGRPTWPWALAARELDDPTFAGLQASARALGGGGELDGARARALAAELRMAVGLKGRRQTATYLERALRDLRAEVGERDEVELLAQEIDRLEGAYG
jgi:geranylgeranyl pyrophosphate synthase